MNNRVLIALCLALATQGNLWSQAARNSGDRPGRALLAPLRPGMAWRVEKLPQDKRTRSPAEAKVKSGRSKENTTRPDSLSPEVIEENVIGVDFRKQILFIQKQKLVRYAVGKMIVMEPSSGRELSIEPSDEEAYGGVLSARRMLEFNWLRPAYVTGTSTVDGIECDIYEAPWPTPLETGAETANASEPEIPAKNNPGGPKVLAAISRKDRLPVRLEDPIQVLRYRFEPLKAPPELPSEIAQALQENEEAIRREIQRYQIPQ